MGRRRTRRTVAQKRMDEAVGTKVCTVCMERKPFHDYHRDKNRDDLCKSVCKLCVNKHPPRGNKNRSELSLIARKRGLKKKYGITIEDYDKMFKKQGGKCAICGTTDVGHKTNKNFCVDHDHTTGKVRGLLCSHCNIGLGRFSDSVGKLREAIRYLEVNCP